MASLGAPDEYITRLGMNDCWSSRSVRNVVV
jgi:hypothetical protein